jgi:hypothetical protein
MLQHSHDWIRTQHELWLHNVAYIWRHSCWINKLNFFFMQWQLEEASRNKNLAETQACYKETEVMLKDVMDRMTIMYKTIWHYLIKLCYYYSYQNQFFVFPLLIIQDKDVYLVDRKMLFIDEFQQNCQMYDSVLYFTSLNTFSSNL